MPAISGLDFLKIVRKEDLDIPFLLFTARGSEAVASEAIKNNITGYVLKSNDPDQFDQLAQQIRSTVGLT
jgi:DNA-binding NarL/FixJ family response regulator